MINHRIDPSFSLSLSCIPARTTTEITQHTKLCSQLSPRLDAIHLADHPCNIKHLNPLSYLKQLPSHPKVCLHISGKYKQKDLDTYIEHALAIGIRDFICMSGDTTNNTNSNINSCQIIKRILQLTDSLNTYKLRIGAVADFKQADVFQRCLEKLDAGAMFFVSQGLETWDCLESIPSDLQQESLWIPSMMITLSEMDIQVCKRIPNLRIRQKPTYNNLKQTQAYWRDDINNSINYLKTLSWIKGLHLMTLKLHSITGILTC